MLILTGVRGLSGRRVKLEALRVGSRWLTTEAALQRFSDALGGTDAAAPPNPPAPPRSPAARQTASERAAAELEALGA